jgi:hypothetical protein
MSLTYSTYVATLANLAVVDAANDDFVQVLPSVIDYAEQRIYRELDILNTVVRSTGVLSVGSRTFNLPTSLGRYVVTNGINIITPASTVTPDEGTRNPAVPASRDMLDSIWPSTTGAGVPAYYAMITDQQVIFGPAPDASYTAEVIGTIRPTPLSSSNETTYLTLYLPDLFVAASMIFISGWQKNFGAQADNPQMASSWQAQYEKLFPSANVEEQRKRFASGAWGSLQPTTIATPSR